MKIPILTYDEVLELLPAYVLEALEPEEMLAVDDYINAHRTLLQRVDDSEQAVMFLAETAPAYPLPATVKTSLMARVEADLAQTTISAKSKPRREGPSWRDLFKQWFTPHSLWMATAVSALIVLVAVTTYAAQLVGRHQQAANHLAQLEATNSLLTEQLQINQDNLSTINAQLTAALDHNGRLQETNTSLQTTNLQLIQQLQTNEDNIIDVTDQLVTVIDRNQAIEDANTSLQAEFTQIHNRLTIASSATQAAILHSETNSRGAFYVSDDNGLLVLHGLTPLPSDQTYQFWLVTPDSEQIPAGLVEVESNEAPTWANISLPTDAPPIVAVGISIEPAGGSPSPTGYMLLEGKTS